MTQDEAATRRGLGLGSIRVQLLGWFLGLALVPLGIAAWVVYDAASDAFRRAALGRVDDAARARMLALEQFAADRLRALSSIAQAPGFIAACREFSAAVGDDGTVDSGRFAAAVGRHAAFLRNFEESYEAGDTLLLDATGRIVFSSRQRSLVGGSMGDALWVDSVFASTVASVERRIEPAIATADAPRAGRDTASWAVGPLVERGVLIGTIAIELPARQIEAIVTDRSGLGASGEIVVASTFADRILSVGPLRGQPDAAFRAAIAGGSALAARIEAAAAGRDGVGPSRSIDGEPVLAAWTYVPSFGWSLTAEQSTSEAFAAITTLRDGALVSFAALVVSVAAIAILRAKRFSDPLMKAAGAAHRIAVGDLTRAPEPAGRGETRVLLEAIRETNDDLAALVRRIKDAAGQIVSSSGSVRGVAARQSSVVRDLAASTAQVAAATQQMSTTSKELGATMSGLARSAELAATNASTGRESLGELARQMARLADGGRSVAEKLEAIRERAGRIDTMVGAITKVANQTNLLAVNAAIEAEKAGAAGQGFQVVAREIDRLATQTAASVLEIEEVVVSVQQAVTEGVLEVGQFNAVLGEGCTTADDVSSRMGTVIRHAEELRSEFEQVAQVVVAQSEGVAQVSEAMTRIAAGTRETSAAAEENVGASGALDEAARALDSEVARFRLPEAITSH